ncbi:DUF2795 domain-containing protein [Actinomycetes bacterium KLBMP 9797]
MANPVALVDLLAGLDYPISREDVIRLAQERGADTDTLHMLQSLPAQEFTSVQQISEALSGG